MMHGYSYLGVNDNSRKMYKVVLTLRGIRLRLKDCLCSIFVRKKQESLPIGTCRIVNG